MENHISFVKTDTPCEMDQETWKSIRNCSANIQDFRADLSVNGTITELKKRMQMKIPFIITAEITGMHRTTLISVWMVC